MIASRQRQRRARILGPDGRPMNRLAYDATVDKHRGQPPPSSTKDEDLILKPADRRKLVAQSRDIHRNFTIAGWMIRKHLDYTSTFAFQARTGMPEVDEQMEALIRWWSRPANCDVAGRHTLQRLTRLWEERRTIDGDVFVLKLSDGRVQSIESAASAPWPRPSIRCGTRTRASTTRWRNRSWGQMDAPAQTGME